jgi:hypothetical protein
MPAAANSGFRKRVLRVGRGIGRVGILSLRMRSLRKSTTRPRRNDWLAEIVSRGRAGEKCVRLYWQHDPQWEMGLVWASVLGWRISGFLKRKTSGTGPWRGIRWASAVQSQSRCGISRARFTEPLPNLCLTPSQPEPVMHTLIPSCAAAFCTVNSRRLCGGAVSRPQDSAHDAMVCPLIPRIYGGSARKTGHNDGPGPARQDQLWPCVSPRRVPRSSEQCTRTS